jgi:hypothetical protein
METTINLTERFDALMARRELRNPGLKNVRIYKFGNKSALLWDHLIMPRKSELLKNFK